MIVKPNNVTKEINEILYKWQINDYDRIKFMNK